MHPTLLIGPADWDAARMPKSEFDSRIAALWQACPQATGAIVYGSPRHHAELAYLTAVTPKLESAIALIPRAGAPRLMVGGGANMLPSARPLTWIEDLVSLRPTGKTISEWLATDGGAKPVIIGSANMPMRLHQEVMTALDGKVSDDATARLHGLMARKSAAEIAAVREACMILDAAVAAMADAAHNGSGATAVILAGEHAAIRRGAQDVRTLFALEPSHSLQPFTEPVKRAANPLRVYVAVCRSGYWADGFVVLPQRQRTNAAGQGETLRAAIAALRTGAAVPSSLVATGIGLSLDGRAQRALTPGGIYSVRLQAEPVTASAMVLVEDNGVTTLWSSP